MSAEIKNYRIEIVDALRGFAILCIVLLHNMEHFEFYYFPKQLPEWLKILDKNILNSAYFLFGGKAYAIFALLFGFSFYVQMRIKISKAKILEFVFYGDCFCCYFLDF